MNNNNNNNNNNRDGLPASLRAKADLITQRHAELKRQIDALSASNGGAGLARPSSSPSSASSSFLDSGDADDDDDKEEDSVQSDDIVIDPNDLSGSDRMNLSEEEEEEDEEALSSSESEHSVPDVDPDDDDDVSDDDDDVSDDDDDDKKEEEEEEEMDVAQEEEVVVGAEEKARAIGTTARAHLNASQLSALPLLIDNANANDTLRTVYMRYGHPEAVVNAIGADEERDLMFALSIQREHILRIFVAPPAAGAGDPNNIGAALRARAKSSRDLRHARTYMNGLCRPVISVLLKLGMPQPSGPALNKKKTKKQKTTA
jgi:hypothetical protein